MVKKNSKTVTRGPDPIRIAVVLSAGGLRGAAHVGVLRELIRHGVPFDRIVGVSAGAVIAAYYAAVGLDLDDLIEDAERFRGRHLLAYSVNVHFDHRFEPRVGRWCGVIPNRLRQLEAVCDTLEALGRNANRMLALETMLLWLREIERGRSAAVTPWTSIQ